MPKHIDDILLAAGIPAEDVVKLNTLPEADQATFDAKPYVDKVRTNYSTQLANDPAFFTDLTLDKLPPEVKKKVESAQYGRAANITRDKFLKGLGMTEEDIADLTPEQKEKLELYIPAVTEKYAKTKAGDKQLQNDLIATRKELEKFDGYEDKMKLKYDTEYNDKYTAAVLNSALLGELSSIPGLKINAADIAKTAHDLLNNKFDFERVGDFGVELRQKGNKAMKVLKPNSSHELTLKDALLEIATERGWIEKQQQGGNGSGIVQGAVIPGANGQLKMTLPPHLADKISQNIAIEKKVG
jgi:hypothetical protein